MASPKAETWEYVWKDRDLSLKRSVIPLASSIKTSGVVGPMQRKKVAFSVGDRTAKKPALAFLNKSFESPRGPDAVVWFMVLIVKREDGPENRSTADLCTHAHNGDECSEGCVNSEEKLRLFGDLTWLFYVICCLMYAA